MPRWKDFSITDFVGSHRNLALSDVAAAEAELRFRMFGSGAAELLGGDLTGRRLSEAFPVTRQDSVIAHFEAIRTDRLIGLQSANVPIPGLEHRRFSVVELPLENEAGEVSQILHAFAGIPYQG